MSLDEGLRSINIELLTTTVHNVAIGLDDESPEYGKNILASQNDNYPALTGMRKAVHDSIRALSLDPEVERAAFAGADLTQLIFSEYARVEEELKQLPSGVLHSPEDSQN